MATTAVLLCASLIMKEIWHRLIYVGTVFFLSVTKLTVQVLCPFFLLRGCSYGFVRPLYIFGKLALYEGVNIFSKFAIFLKCMVVLQHRILSFYEGKLFSMGPGYLWSNFKDLPHYERLKVSPIVSSFF